MLFLRFAIATDHYVIEASHVAEVLPWLALKRLPAAPPWVAGAFSYRGESVPVIDLTHLATGVPAPARRSTRLVLVHYPAPGPSAHRLGVLVERATDTLRADAAAFQPSGVDLSEGRYLGPVLDTDDGLVQWVRVDQLLTDAARALLFDAARDAMAEAAAARPASGESP
ncbi:purine-binding chemotaxis protein CheW [Pandoraea pnomenusa]|uniref:chemotaxis protein CheW n=1 Tax=Pandoraea pnomenusa TaxID=93220 RepID=UPI001198C37B|nr:chemotaxis protein CheW [Pandoraea pnomenusa]QDX24078.1 purine-binding chemotaxis protein CheW [Pandoraea pnomenusa]